MGALNGVDALPLPDKYALPKNPKSAVHCSGAYSLTAITKEMEAKGPELPGVSTKYVIPIELSCVHTLPKDAEGCSGGSSDESCRVCCQVCLICIRDHAESS